MEEINNVWDQILEVIGNFWRLFTIPIFSLGEVPFSLGTIIYITVAFTLLFYVTKKLKQVLIRRLLGPHSLSKGIAVSIGTIVRFVLILIGTIAILQSAGIDISTVGLIAGGLGIGIGFGLQNITDNFISGIVILFEKPVKVGDRVQIGDIEGDVVNIAVRSTTIQTNDNISIIVPNSQFISNTVIIGVTMTRSVRYRLPVGVSYSEDPELVRDILLSVANDSPSVLKDPPPKVLFTSYGESSLDFELAVWTQTHTDKPRILKSDLYFEIFRRFKSQGVEIPFPQRDLHIRSSAVALK